MAEEEDSNKHKKLSEYKESVTSIGNSWIICRSQSHGGRIYYFNTLTGKAVWNLSDSEIKKAQLHTMAMTGQLGTSIQDCPEPMEPPGDSPECREHPHNAQKVRSPRIYNKQIINNQFTKPFALPPFVKPQCHCASLSPMDDASVNFVSAPVYNPSIWAVSPTQQVFLASTVSPFINQSQPIYKDPSKLPVQNGAVPLSSRFKIMNQLVNNMDSHTQGVHTNRPRFQNFPVRRQQSLFTRKYQNKINNDLRDVLSSRRKDNIRNDNEFEEVHTNFGNNVYDILEIREDDLYPSDIDDEWLKEHTAGEDENIKLDVSSIWRLTSGGAKTNCWFIIANIKVLLNHMSFLSRLIDSDERMHLLTPVEVLKRLRSATGAGAARLAQRARRAVRYATQQLNKVPAALKNLQNDTITSCCIELSQQDYHAVLLVNDTNELQNVNVIECVPIFTINELKKHLTRNSYAPKTESPGNITITVLPSKDANIECFHEDNSHSPLWQSTGEAFNVEKTENNTYEVNSFGSKEIEIQTDEIESSVKKTVNASVQTDFEIKLGKSPNCNSESLNPNSFVKPLDVDNTLKINTVVESPNISNEELKVVPKKIKLNRNKLTAITKPVKTSTHKWRKRRVNTPQTNPLTPPVDADTNKHTQQPNSPPPLPPPHHHSPSLSKDGLILQHSDNAVDYGKNTEVSNESVVLPEVNEKVTDEETCTLNVKSNSVDSKNMSEINKKGVTNESKDNENEDIVVFEVAGELMDEYLIMRRDEWVSRFVQIMEEALTQILQLEPCFIDSSIPPPWSIQEATECIKRKFINNSKVKFAAEKFGAILHQITDSQGKIYAELNPSDFMKMYSYGVYLINALQELLMDSEDLQIARKSLSKLLEDIRDPNLDVSHNVFIDDDKVAQLVNRTEEVTNVGDDIVPASKEITQIEDILVSNNKALSLNYNLRSKSRTEQKKMTEVKIIRSINDDESFFTSLRLQKTNISPDGCDIKASPVTSHSQQKSIQDSNDDTNSNSVEKIEPKIIRNFNICPKMEETLKSKKNSSLQRDLDDEYFADDNNCLENDFSLDNKDYTNAVNEDKHSKSSRSGDLDTQTFLKWFMDRTTYPIHRILIEVHRFCNETYTEVRAKEKMEQKCIIRLFEKTTKLNTHMEILCKYLNRILHRNNTESKFRCMMKELGCDNIAISSSQVEEYGALIEKYLDQANLLLESVNLIAASIKEIIIMQR